jgi:hypothetical protein
VADCYIDCSEGDPWCDSCASGCEDDYIDHPLAGVHYARREFNGAWSLRKLTGDTGMIDMALDDWGTPHVLFYPDPENPEDQDFRTGPIQYMTKLGHTWHTFDTGIEADILFGGFSLGRMRVSPGFFPVVHTAWAAGDFFDFETPATITYMTGYFGHWTAEETGLQGPREGLLKPSLAVSPWGSVYIAGTDDGPSTVTRRDVFGMYHPLPDPGSYSSPFFSPPFFRDRQGRLHLWDDMAGGGVMWNGTTWQSEDVSAQLPGYPYFATSAFYGDVLSTVAFVDFDSWRLLQTSFQ